MSLLTTLFLFHRDVSLLFMMGILSSNPTFFCGFPGLLGSSWLVFVEGLDVSLAPWDFLLAVLFQETNSSNSSGAQAGKGVELG